MSAKRLRRARAKSLNDRPIGTGAMIMKMIFGQVGAGYRYGACRLEVCFRTDNGEKCVANYVSSCTCAGVSIAGISGNRCLRLIHPDKRCNESAKPVHTSITPANEAIPAIVCPATP